MGSYIINVPKLKGRENFDDWAFAAKNFLILEGIDLDKQYDPKTETIDPVEDKKAKAKLIMTIDPSLYVHIKNEETVSDLWNKLKKLFDDSGFTRRISLLRTLISIRLDNCESMTSYVTHVVETAQRLKGTGFDINDMWIGSLLLAGLPEKYAPMLMAIEHSGLTISADTIKTKLLDMSNDVGNDGETAFLSRNSQHVKTAGKGGKTFPSGSTSAPKPKINKKIRCYNCKQLGHYKNQCPTQKEKQTNAFSAAFLNGQFCKDDWYVDSGASAHMTANRDSLTNVQQITKEIIVANQMTIPVLCVGDTQITTRVNSSQFDITVNNVLCIPKLTTNLLSVSQLMEKGNKVTFTKNACHIYSPHKLLIGVAVLENGVYKLDTIKSENILTAAVQVSSIVWHRRLGHINSRDLAKMKNGAAEGIEYKGKAGIDKSNCVSCCEGKQARLPFQHIGSRCEQLLEVVHADVCGPMETKSIGQARYFLLFVDDSSRMSFVYFLKEKNQVFQRFKEFKNMAETQTGVKIKVLRTDNGGEFCSKQMESYLSDAGIIHQKSNPYTPEQNGLCERFNRTVVERARCLLFDAKLDKHFWAEAVNTAVYLKNRSPASGLNDMTPFERWTGKKPDVSHVRLFGSPVMVHVPKERRLKWDKKATKHILVGYAENVKGYRLYNPETRSVTTSRDVIIMEMSDDTPGTIPVTVNEVEEGDDVQSVEELSSDSDISKEDPNFIGRETSTDSESTDDYVNALSDENNVVDSQSLQKLPDKRPRRPPNRYGFTNLCAINEYEDGMDQLTLEEAMNAPDKLRWQQAMEQELKAFEENDAWELVERNNADRVVQCKWVFKKKLDSDNSVRYRARLVAKGFTQKEGVDFKDTFSPVLRYSTLRLLFALSVKLNLNITHLDVTTAFLNGFLEENVYMEVPASLKCDNSNKVLKLKRAIYGLKQSARAWNKRVDDCLKQLGYSKSKLEPCLYTKIVNSAMTIVAIFVDDFFVFSNNENMVIELKAELKSKFKIKDLGQLKQCLGMRVRISNESISIDQEQFLEQILRKFNMTNCKTSKTPMECNLKLEKANNTCQTYPYQQLIGSLMYLSVLTRPDISYSVSYLSQFNNCHNEQHWKQAKRVLRYLNKTRSYGLVYKKDDCNLEGFVDADWASNILDRKSYTGFCFKLSGSVVSYECKKQQTIALSSTEAEYMAITEACKEAIYLKNLLLEIKCNTSCIVLYNDNQGAQKLSENPLFHKRTKHIDIRYHFIREAVANNIVKIVYLPTHEMPADILTKSLNSVKHDRFVAQLGMSE